MKRKVLLLVFVILLISVLAGCGIVPNQSPIASFSASPTSGVASLEVFFDASGSYDPDGNIVSYEWNFKDGDTGSGKIVNHTFSSTGSYDVKLTVTDNKGAIDSVTKTITVTDPITEPVPLGTPLTKEGITVTVERIELIESPLCGQAFEVEIYFSVINNSESTLRGPGRFDYVLDEKIYEDEFNSIGYLHIGDGISWIYPRQSRSVGYNYCFHSPVTIKQITWTGTFTDDQDEIELGPWEN